MKKSLNVFRVIIISLAFIASPLLSGDGYDSDKIEKVLHVKMKSLEKIKAKIADQRSLVYRLKNEVKKAPTRLPESKEKTSPTKTPVHQVKMIKKPTLKATVSSGVNETDCHIYLDSILSLMKDLQDLCQQLKAVSESVHRIKSYLKTKQSLAEEEKRSLQDELSMALKDMQDILDDIENTENMIATVRMAYKRCVGKKPLSSEEVQSYERKFKKITFK